jgi:diaminopimelate epimerase
MHGAENDYIFFDGFSGPLPRDSGSLAPRICRRYAHVGADGIICMVPPRDHDCDVEMRIWNADGSSATMCGNGARCIAVWMQREGYVNATCRILAGGRVVTAREIKHQDQSGSATVEMGCPELLTSREGQLIDLVDSTTITVHSVQIGNPHAVVFTEDLSDRMISNVGPQIEHHADFPQRTNVELVDVRGPNELRMRVWERGSGETRACGSGACAAVAAATHTGRIRKNQLCQVGLPGGTLEVHWRADGELLLSGPVEIAFSGTLIE